MIGKIVKGIAGFYYIDDGEGHIYECKAKGIFRNQNIKPLVGDDVEITILSEEAKEGNVDRILKRTNALIRPAVANVDQALVLFSITQPDPNFNLLDRFLVMMEVQSIPVVLCFNKIDLTEDEACDTLKQIYESAGYRVYFASTYEDKGIEEIRSLIAGKTTVLAGPSGVGKSSLTNKLYPKASMETGVISEKIKRGKHTTRHSELFSMGHHTYMMDTPGFSSMFIDEMEPERLKDYFPEFASYEDDCKFLGCVHIGETVCGVKTAVAEGQISKNRYDNYRLFYEELKNKRRY